MTTTTLIRNLQKPKHPIDIVLDTDTFNEVDDQFALALILKSSEKLKLQAITAAPFFNEKVSSPAEGLEKSYEEILRILGLMDIHQYDKKVWKGSPGFLIDEQTPIESDAVHTIAKLAAIHSEEDPLYVLAIGAITNIASFILLYPQLVSHIVLIWLGGHDYQWKDTYEFNLKQDIAAARVVFQTNLLPIVQIPCIGVASNFTTTKSELEHWLKGKNPLCDYLLPKVEKQVLSKPHSTCWSKCLWDVVAVSWLLDEEFTEDRLAVRPIPEYDHRYSFDVSMEPINYVYWVYRDKLFTHMVEKLIT